MIRYLLPRNTARLGLKTRPLLFHPPKRWQHDIVSQSARVVDHDVEWPKPRLAGPLGLILIMGTGLVAGSYLGTGIASWLGKDGLDVFTYVPDDDDDDDDDDSQENTNISASSMMRSVFGDHRLNLSFNWSGYDAELITLMRSKLEEELEDLNDTIDNLSLQAMDMKEAQLTRSYLQNLMKVLDERERLLYKDPSVKKSWWNWFS